MTEYDALGASAPYTADGDEHPADRSDAGTRTVRGGVLRIGGYAFGTLFSLIGMVFVTRALGPADFGRFQTVLNLITIVSVVSDVGLATLGVREYSIADEAHRRLMMRALLGLRIALTTVGVGIAIALVAISGGTSLVLWGTLAAGIGLLLSVMQSTFTIPLASSLRFGAVTGLDAGRQAALAAAYVAVAVAGLGLAGFYGAVIPVQIALLVVTLLLCRGAISVLPAIDAAMWRRLVLAGLSFALAATVGIIYQYTAQILTALVSTEVQAGLFASALRIYIVVGAIPGLVVAGALPILSRSAKHDAKRFGYAVRLLTDTTLAVGGALGVAMAVGAPVIVRIVGGPEFAGAVDSTRLLGPAIIVSSAIATWGYALLALHRHRAIAVANAIALVASVAISLPLARLYGATGAAVATLIVEFVLAIAYGVALRRTGEASLPRARTYVAVAAGFAVGLGVALVPGLPSLLAAVIATVLYGAVVLAFRILPRELLDAVPHPLQRLVEWGMR